MVAVPKEINKKPSDMLITWKTPITQMSNTATSQDIMTKFKL